MDIMSCEDMLYDTPYSLCGFCREKIMKREDARWVCIGTEWDQISCTECAGKHDPLLVREVERPPAVDIIISADKEIDELERTINELKNLRVKMIKQILEDEGYREGMQIHFRHKPYIATRLIIGTSRIDPVKIELSPVTKKGDTGKYNKTEMIWTDFIRLWRMQRADTDAYLEHCRRHEEDIKRRRTMRITDDQV